jgi:hypothetical protein
MQRGKRYHESVKEKVLRFFQQTTTQLSEFKILLWYR